MEVFNITLPTSWAELSDKQLLMVYGLFARDLSAAEVKTLSIMKWNSLKVLATLPHHRFLIKRKEEPEVALSTRQIQQATSVLDFLDNFPPMPVRIARIGKYHALPADFEKVPFEQYLFVDNLFQGYLNTQSDELLLQMAQVLYASDHVKPDKAQLVGIFYWIASLKQYFAGLFPNFYKPASSTDGNLLGNGQTDLYHQLRDSTNAMIRALTGGDITKEAAIMKMDTWRALTELDAIAREAEEIRKTTNKA
ncbi:hypothetical protein SAMN02910409_2212 [Prevotellaceae bacterium HUN156]|nr:hypothetical protein SAMN02910409_2212 [Prevotellaceae bacterium HUN156]